MTSFHKIAVSFNIALFKPSLHFTGAQVPFLYSQRRYVSPIPLSWKFSTRIGITSFLQNLCLVDLFDQVSHSKISIIDKTEALAYEVVAKPVKSAVDNETLIPEDFKMLFNQPKIVDRTTCLCGWI